MLHYMEKRDFTDVITLRNLKWKDYPSLSKGVQCHHKGVCKREARGLESERRCDDGNRRSSDTGP